MPFTPYHFGVGLALKAGTAPVFSWFAFCVTQVVIDCETLFYIVRNEYPVHRSLHTFLGAGLVGALVSAVLLLMLRAVDQGRSMFMGARWPRSPLFKGEMSAPGVWLGGLVGGLSHPLLDGLMHRDVRPFMPWSSWNPLLGVVGLGALYQACLVAAALGVAGVGIWALRTAKQAG